MSASFNNVLSESQVKVSADAAEKMAGLLADADDEIKGIRVYVSGGGCGGMSYGMTFTDDVTEFDCELKLENFSLYVDSVALGYLAGVEIDYVDRPTGASFVFNNVFASTGGSGACGGCGSSGGGCGTSGGGCG